MFSRIFATFALFCGISLAAHAQYTFQWSTDAVPAPILPPELISIFPNSGPTTGGQVVTLSGANFVNPEVRFGGVPASSVQLLSSGELQVTTPAHSWGLVQVSVINENGDTAALEDAYTFSAPAPLITSITPDEGVYNGAVSVDISGANFLATPRVFFSDQEAAVTYVNSSLVTAVAPSQAAGFVGVTLENPDGKSAHLPNAYQYLTEPPVISGLAPASVVDTGGTTVTLSGEHFIPSTQILLDGASVGTVYQSNQTLTFSAPAGTIGQSMVVTTLNSDAVASVNSANLHYIAPTPSLTTRSPSSVADTGGTTVTVYGSNFRSGATVSVGGTVVSSTYISATQLRFTAPAKSAGSYTLQVLNPGDVVSSNTLTLTYYVPPPVLSSLSPSSVLYTGGTRVTVYGSNFRSGVTIYVGGSAVSTTYISSTQVRFTAPAKSISSYSVQAYNVGSTGSNALTLNYVAPTPTLSSLSPSPVATTGGTLVTVYGSNFVNGAQVTVSGVAVSTTYINSTQVRFSAPAKASAGNYPVRVSNPGGVLSSTSLYLGYVQMEPAPTITTNGIGTMPCNGYAKNATILGTNFREGYKVYVNGVEHPYINPVNETSFGILILACQYPVGTHYLTVKTPDGQWSNASAFTVTP